MDAKLRITSGDAEKEILDELQKPARPEPVSNPHQQSEYGVGILLALTVLGKHVYAGTVGRVEKLRRRARGKRARLARKRQR